MKKIFFINKKVHITPSLEVYMSNQPDFENYYSTSIYYRQYNPTQYSNTLFLFDFRSSSYAGLGMAIDYNIFYNLDIHIAPNLFLPYIEKVRINGNKLNFLPLSYYNLLTEVALVYHTRFGPLSLSFNALDKDFTKTSILINFGYILFNHK